MKADRLACGLAAPSPFFGPRQVTSLLAEAKSASAQRERSLVRHLEVVQIVTDVSEVEGLGTHSVVCPTFDPTADLLNQNLPFKETSR